MAEINEAKALHHCILMIAKEIHRICESNGIKCFLIGGSLLGAIRHGGFIPWDDDLDFGILRNDYDKFIRICEAELDKRFVLHQMQNTENYGFSFAKIKLKGTHFYEEGNPKECFDGIFVDVFPIDKMPHTKLTQVNQKNRLKFLYGTLKYKSGNRSNSKVKNIIKTLLFSIPALQSRNRLSKKIIKVQTKYNANQKSTYYINLCSSYKYGREKFPLVSFEGDLSKIQFEQETFYIPNCPKEILTLLYGDFMKLPPVEKQCFKHSGKDIDFGPYKTEN